MARNSKHQKKPPWLKVNFSSNQNYFDVSKILKEKGLHTICQSAKCPNISECWGQKTATFLILGDVCTRNCAFCAVKSGTPSPPKKDEGERIAEAAVLMGLQYVVITSVTRDDLDDGGAFLFASTIEKINEKAPETKVEVLIPDFRGEEEPLQRVLEAQPEVLNHNVEVPETLYPSINRPPINYLRSLKVLEQAKKRGAWTKSGIMVGLGETKAHILQTFSGLRNVSCDLLTIGQYLQPSRSHYPVKKYYSPLEFKQLKKIALDFGFKQVESGPLVRSSYRAHTMYHAACADTA
ncbi:lipoyl synthase [bacterium]|nr:lipoyl synthase [bacterium]